MSIGKTITAVILTMIVNGEKMKHQMRRIIAVAERGWINDDKVETAFFSHTKIQIVARRSGMGAIASDK